MGLRRLALADKLFSQRFGRRARVGSSAVGHSRRYCHVRSLVRYPQHRTLPHPTETRLLAAFLRRSVNNGHSRRSSCVLTSLDLRGHVPKIGSGLKRRIGGVWRQ